MARKSKEDDIRYYHEHKAEKQAYSKKYYQENKERCTAYNNDYVNKHKERVWATASIATHKRRGMSVDITLDELEVLAKHTTRCEYCGVELIYRNRGGVCKQSATVDRIDNEDVLTVHNIRLVCNMCNVTKNSRTFAQFVSYCTYIANRFKQEEEFK